MHNLHSDTETLEIEIRIWKSIVIEPDENYRVLDCRKYVSIACNFGIPGGHREIKGEKSIS